MRNSRTKMLFPESEGCHKTNLLTTTPMYTYSTKPEKWSCGRFGLSTTPAFSHPPPNYHGFRYPADPAVSMQRASVSAQAVSTEHSHSPLVNFPWNPSELALPLPHHSPCPHLDWTMPSLKPMARKTYSLTTGGPPICGFCICEFTDSIKTY